MTGTSQVVLWLRLCTPNAGGWGSIPGQGLSHMLQLRVHMLQLKIRVLQPRPCTGSIKKKKRMKWQRFKPCFLKIRATCAPCVIHKLFFFLSVQETLLSFDRRLLMPRGASCTAQIFVKQRETLWHPTYSKGSPSPCHGKSVRTPVQSLLVSMCSERIRTELHERKSLNVCNSIFSPHPSYGT